MYDISQFGFEPVAEIPVDENDWKELIKSFMSGADGCIAKKVDGSKASNMAAAIRKAAKAMEVDGLKVVTKGDTVYLRKA